MTDASTSRGMSPELRKVAERAKREPEAQFHSLAHLIDEQALERAYDRLRKDAAVGVDGSHEGAVRAGPEERLRGPARADEVEAIPASADPTGAYPQGAGQNAADWDLPVEDKMVQDALSEVLEAIYEQDFLDCSYGFRPGAVRTMRYGP